ncbi:MAG: hypothetical protein K8F55_18715, partial [Candidatus Methanoperedens nitroreducens]|nr:hypothetical protein [Candidatus Methanoperedens nitroreducens]
HFSISRYFWMKPFLTKGYAKRKLHTGNQSVQFDEEVEVGKPLLYSTISVHLRFQNPKILLHYRSIGAYNLIFIMLLLLVL